MQHGQWGQWGLLCWLWAPGPSIPSLLPGLPAGHLQDTTPEPTLTCARCAQPALTLTSPLVTGTGLPAPVDLLGLLLPVPPVWLNHTATFLEIKSPDCGVSPPWKACPRMSEGGQDLVAHCWTGPQGQGA